MDKKKILVTGGAGYIGSITTAELVKAGYPVVVYDNLYQGHIDAVHPDAQFVKGDLADRQVVSERIPADRWNGCHHQNRCDQ